MKKARFLWIVPTVALLVLAAPSPEALANCAVSSGYKVTAEGSTVTICPKNFSDRSCPDDSGLLREDVATRSAVLIPDRCQDQGDEEASCYIDTCVPPGTYRYGYAEPYECFPASCSTDYFSDVTVEPWSGDCDPGDDLVAEALMECAPWGDQPVVCTFGGGSPSGGPPKPVCDDNDDDGGRDGCTLMSPPTSVPLKVFGVNALVVLGGVAFLLLRRR